MALAPKDELLRKSNPGDILLVIRKSARPAVQVSFLFRTRRMLDISAERERENRFPKGNATSNIFVPGPVLINPPSVDDFDARSSDELSLRKGDKIELIERDDDFGDGWYLGKHTQNGNTGLFPEGLYCQCGPGMDSS
jgi:hypothetical protein